MSLQALQKIRAALFTDRPDEIAPLNAQAVICTLWADGLTTLRDYLDCEIDRELNVTQDTTGSLFHFEHEPMTAADAAAYRIECADRVPRGPTPPTAPQDSGGGEQ